MKTDFYRRQFLAGALLWLLPAVLWAPAFGRAFVSEDFLILARLDQGAWQVLKEALAGPWLGIELVKFYRPVSTGLLALEAALFGLHPLPYAVAHWLVHGLNAWLVLRVLRAWTPTLGALPPMSVAVLFAVYPLHLNAVLFIASFATLFSATFGLGFLFCFLRWRATAAVGWLAAGAGLLALALGSYEGAAVLPAVALALDGIGPPASGRISRRLLPVPHALFFGLLCAYLLLRRGLFDHVLGGYDDTRARLLEGAVSLVSDLLESLFRLGVPVYGAQPPSLPGVVVAIAVLGILILGCWARWGGPRKAGHEEPPEEPDAGPSRRRRSSWGAWLLVGPVWAALHQAPYVFAPVVPGNGRYWYLASAGAALVVVALAGLLAELAVGADRRSSSSRHGGFQEGRFRLPAAVGGSVLGVTLVLGVFWSVVLRGYAQDYARAGELARALPRALEEQQLTPGQRIFITGYPLFVHDAGGAPVAQVFRWGLRDALRPPFQTPGLDVLPLPDVVGGGLLPVATGEPTAAIFRWDGEAQELRRFVPTAGLWQATADAAKLAVLEPTDVATVRVERPPGPLSQATLFVVTAANTARLPLAVGERSGAILEGSLPMPLLRAANKLYPGQPAFWWVEARGPNAKLVGYSVMRRIPD